MSGHYTPRTPPVEAVDFAIDTLRANYPNALERPDFVDGAMTTVAALNGSLSRAIEDPETPPGARDVLMSVSRNLGDNYSLYQAVRDVLFVPTEAPS